jgi:hypothetical protein
MSAMKFVISHDELKKLMDSIENIPGAKKLIQLEVDFDSSNGRIEPTLHVSNLFKLADGKFQASASARKPACPNPPCICC